MTQIVTTLREADIMAAERDHALLNVFHATGVEKGAAAKNFASVAKSLRAIFAPAPRQSARQLFAALKARAAGKPDSP